MPNIVEFSKEKMELEYKEKYATESRKMMEGFIENVNLYREFKEKYKYMCSPRELYVAFVNMRKEALSLRDPENRNSTK